MTLGKKIPMNRAPADIWKDNRYLLTDEQQVIDRIVKPILSCLGWDTTDPLQVEFRAKNAELGDIYLRNSELIVACLECKKLHADEFCIVRSKGRITTDHKTPNKDGVAQIKNDCRSICNQQCGVPPIPVFTNGLRWVIFNADTFLSDDNENNPVQPATDILIDAVVIETSFLDALNVLKRA